MFSNSRKSYGDFDRILPISGNDYFLSVNILCPLRTEQMQYLYSMGFLLLERAVSLNRKMNFELVILIIKTTDKVYVT